jgi:hypothetical protein
MVQFLLTWAEDKATVGTDPSADPGAKTEGAALCRPVFSLRDWRQCAKSVDLATSGSDGPQSSCAFGCHGLVYGFARSRSCRMRLHPYPSLREYVCPSADAPVAKDRARSSSSDRPVTEGRLNH